ncbi:hypothetical protein PIB30_062983 [Stylosanthes scabra]|uniref:RNase H type-1 domain-containing protein n=1 Tax=Stylosanthes scabra TaxID=79078 RepID=A0ABU6ZK39_9FABA|nr:hypothetical protein [Stylosanthes scabra]
MAPEDAIGFGCVIRDSKGVWQWGVRVLFLAPVFSKENFLLFGEDSSVAIGSDANDLIMRIRELLHHFWRAEIALIQRTANYVADALVKHTLKEGIHHADWLQPWSDLETLLYKDMGS